MVRTTGTSRTTAITGIRSTTLLLLLLVRLLLLLQVVLHQVAAFWVYVMATCSVNVSRRAREVPHPSPPGRIYVWQHLLLVQSPALLDAQAPSVDCADWASYRSAWDLSCQWHAGQLLQEHARRKAYRLDYEYTAICSLRIRPPKHVISRAHVEMPVMNLQERPSYHVVWRQFSHPAYTAILNKYLSLDTGWAKLIYGRR